MSNVIAFAHTSPGSKHDICQDWSCCYPTQLKQARKYAIAVVADGHGSKDCFRSKEGAEFAASVALDSIKQFFSDDPPEMRTENIKRREECIRILEQYIISQWYQKINEHATANPFQDDPRYTDVSDIGRAEYESGKIAHAYGTTVLAVALTDDYWFGIRVGDGKCLVLFEDGTWDQPIPWDDRCFMNRTTSLSNSDPMDKFRHWFGNSEDGTKRPLALFIGTDGVEDSWPLSEHDMRLKRLYTSAIVSIKNDGIELSLKHLKEYQEYLAAHGSTDDVSIAGIVTTNLDDSLVQRFSFQMELEKLYEELASLEEEEKRAESVLLQFEKQHGQAIEDALVKAQEERENYENYLKQLYSWRENSLKRGAPVNEGCPQIQTHMQYDTPTQKALAKALENKEAYEAERRSLIEKRDDISRVVAAVHESIEKHHNKGNAHPV